MIWNDFGNSFETWNHFGNVLEFHFERRKFPHSFGMIWNLEFTLKWFGNSFEIWNHFGNVLEFHLEWFEFGNASFGMVWNFILKFGKIFEWKIWTFQKFKKIKVQNTVRNRANF